MSVTLLSLVAVLMRLSKAAQMTRDAYNDIIAESNKFVNQKNGMVHYQNQLVTYINGEHKKEQQGRIDKAKSVIDACFAANGKGAYHDACNEYVGHRNKENNMIFNWIIDFNNLVIDESNAVINKQNAVDAKTRGVSIISGDSGVHQLNFAEEKSSRFVEERKGMVALDAAIVKYNNGDKYNGETMRLHSKAMKIAVKCTDNAEDNKQKEVCADMKSMSDSEFDDHNKWHEQINGVYEKENGKLTKKIDELAPLIDQLSALTTKINAV